MALKPQDVYVTLKIVAAKSRRLDWLAASGSKYPRSASRKGVVAHALMRAAFTIV
jgi:hypothetical protein